MGVSTQKDTFPPSMHRPGFEGEKVWTLVTNTTRHGVSDIFTHGGGY